MGDIMLLSKSEIIKAGFILLAAAVVMWAIMIRPHSFAWQAAGQTTASVKSLMSNSTVIGSPQIRAVVTLDSGQNVLIDVPIDSNVRAGDLVNLVVQVDADKQSRKRYLYSVP